MNSEYEEKQVTVRILYITSCITLIALAMIWAICYYSVKAVEHPKQIETKIEQNYERK